MPSPAHTYGPTCVFHEQSSDDYYTQPTDRLEPPRVKAQFFYISALPIDDPLSPLPPPSETKSLQSKAPPQPFSVRDNNALEEAWQGVQAKETSSRPSSSVSTVQQPSGKRLGEIFRFPRIFKEDTDNPAPAETPPTGGNFAHDSDDDDTGLTDSLKEASLKAIPTRELKEKKDAAKKEAKAQKKTNKKPSRTALLQALREEAVAATEQSREEAADGSGPLSKDSLRRHDASSGLAKEDKSDTTGRSQDEQHRAANEETRQEDDRTTTSSGAGWTPSGKNNNPFDDPPEETGSNPQKSGSKGSFLPRPKSSKKLSYRRRDKTASNSDTSGQRLVEEEHRDESQHTDPGSGHPQGRKHYAGHYDGHSDGVVDFSDVDRTYTSGRPFARAPSHKNVRNVFDYAFDGATESSDLDDDESRDDVKGEALKSIGRRSTNPGGRPLSRSVTQSRIPKPQRPSEPQVVVPVGITRLHLVELPQMMMKPIYWSPVNDVARVLRATWFYKNTMSPVEPDVANRLELGYEDMKPWTTTWQDELNSCIEHGPEAEIKVTRRLWPEDEDVKPSRPGSGGEMKMTNEQETGDRQTEQMPEHTMNIAAAPATKAQSSRLFPNHSVIYVDGKDAQLLRPSLAPSITKHRTPLNSIRKGRQIGIAVIRGFDRKAWDSLHPPKKMDAQTANAKVGAYMSRSGDAATRGRRLSCSACQMQETKPAVTDLVLVVHGIGQKLSERMESYHFTHAINTFRRQVNVELVTEAVRGNLRENMGGVMVLPINWRLTLQFDSEGRPTSGPGKRRNPMENDFSLKDITPETLPAVRSLISDVMLDIPYYMSVHKEKMVAAVVKEANRVYRLWCRNNPDFHGSGRVHLVAHSLGSAMSLDILSQQPTKVPKSLDFNARPNDKIFEFDTKSLFCCGSPAGFFLLLNNANLLPRKGRNKPGAEGEDEARGIGGNAGTYGCLAVDNIYNIMHYNDPIAYHMNASVDADYARSLKPGIVPNIKSDWFTSLTQALRWSSDTSAAMGQNKSGRPNMNKLPSTIEMDIHDFTHEELAEKRMYLLNDNGQIDYFLNSGGGPLEIQYLSMLSAHSSYWALQDFVRFIVMEVGRTPGRDGTSPVLRAEKKRIIKAGKIA